MKRINRGIEIIANGICPDKERGQFQKANKRVMKQVQK